MMKAIILNAGQGKRLSNLAEKTPKCLLKLGKKTILDYQLEALKACGVKNSIIILGFEKLQIVDYVKNFYSSLKVDFVFNDNYQTTDNAYSLALGLKKINPKSEKVLIFDGDIIFDIRLLEKLIKSKYQNVALVDNFKEILDDDSKVVVKNNFIVKIGKEFSGCGVYTSMIKFGGKLLEVFNKEINRKSEKKQWYTGPLNRVLEKYPRQLHPLMTDKFWRGEIDTMEDYLYAKKLFREIKKP